MHLTFRSLGVLQTIGVGITDTGLNRSSFYVKVPEDKNLEHEQNAETSCALSKNHSEQKGFQAVRHQQVYYQKQNSQHCKQTVWATAWADRKFWFTADISGTVWELVLPYLGNFQVFPLITHDFSFAVCRGLPPPMGYLQVAGTLDKQHCVLVMKHSNCMLSKRCTTHLWHCFSPFLLSLINFWEREGRFNKRKHAKALVAYGKHWTL